MKTFDHIQIAADRLAATDLRDEACSCPDAKAYKITIYDEQRQPMIESAEALYLLSEGRLGIAWGADATWADVRDVESGIEMWLNDGDAWAAAN